MALTIVFGNTNDNEITSTNASYGTARSGGTLTLGSASGNFISYGQRNFGSGYDCYESFVEFPYTLTATDLKVSAYIQYVQLQNVGSQGRDLFTYENDWGGGTLTTADWVPGLGVALGALFSRIIHSEQWGAVKGRGGGQPLLARLGTTGNVRVVNVSNRFQAGTAPSGDEYNKLYSVDQSGTANDPCLIYTTIRRSTLSWVSAASAQLSDGTHVYVESDGASTPTLTLKYTSTAGVTNTIASVGVGGSNFDVATPSLQKMSLVIDGSDNIFLIGHKAGTNNDLRVNCYKKTGALTWAAAGTLSATLPGYSNSLGIPNNGVGAWHNTGGAGHIVYVGSHIAWTGHTGMVFYAAFGCSNMLAGINDVSFTDSGADPVWLGLATPADFVHYPNETGTLLDVMAIPGTTSGQVHMVDSDGVTTAGRYTVNSSGIVTAGANSATGLITDAISADKDANGKLRTHILADGRYINTNGCRIVARQSAGALLGFDDFDTSTSGVPTNFPTAAAQKGLSTWDSVLDLASNKVWVYYLDSTDSRVLRRTAFSLSTYKSTAESVVVNSTIGATGTTNVSIRAPRGKIDERKVRIAVANVTGAGALSTVYVDDSFNLAPNAPTLGAVPVFDATTPQVFSWAFSDSNPGDVQTAREVSIIRTSDSASMLATGKVSTASGSITVAANTLSNAVAYQWRVRTWDVADAQGAFSAYTDFTTAGGGSVTITDPATDNPGSQVTADYSITWSVSGTTQASYRVKAIDTADSSTYYDSGFVTSTSTTAVAPNLLSGHTYRIEVTVRNAGLVVSNPGTRLISPVYSAPEKPVVSAIALDTFIRVSVDNPVPVGSEPDVIVNRIFRRKTGDTAWTFIGSMPPGDTFDDYDIGAGISYDYRAGGEA